MSTPESTSIARFSAEFGFRPTHVVRAPGRVNLIGEHTDYNGLPVFPMAIQRAVEIAFRARDDGVVRLHNADPAHGARSFELGRAIPPFAQGDWGNYAKAAAQILSSTVGITRGFDGLVSGDIPPAAGLSSSSALVVACALALVDANEVEVWASELMALAAQGERYVGVQSGGMDQAICLGGTEDHAVVIAFDPLRLEPIRVPTDWRFLVVNSFVSAEKSGRARTAYNTRVVECRDALRLVREHPHARAWPDTYAALVASVARDEITAVASSALADPLRARFRHVVTEGARVAQARAAMLAADIDAFGALMDLSHASLRDDYQVSCAELDEIVVLAREVGAVGARLTGAGFGGCAVVVCRAAEVTHIAQALIARLGPSPSRLGERVIAVAPSAGASVRKLG